MAAALVAAGVTAGCSISQPLGHGSRVPWAGAQLAAAERAAAPRTAATVAAGVSADERYRVRRGDRLGDLARSFKVSVADLARANNLAAPYTIRTGQELRIPAHARGGAPAPTVVAARSSAASKVASIRVSSGQPVRTVASQVTAKPTKVAALEVKVEPSAGPGPTPELKPQKAVCYRCRLSLLSGFRRRLSILA
jgi:LysM repeat protein